MRLRQIFNAVLAAADYIVAVDYIAADSHRIAADYIVVAAYYIADFGRIADYIAAGRKIDYKCFVRCKIERRPVEPPVDSFEVSPAVKFVEHFQDPLELVERLGKCSSREQSAGRKLDWRNGRHPPAVAWNFAASAP